MKYELIQLVDYLYDRGFDKTEILATCNRLKNEQQIEKLMSWMQQRTLLTAVELRKKVIEISYDIYDNFFIECGFDEKETKDILDGFKQYDFINEKKLNIFIEWIKNHKKITKDEIKNKAKDFTDKYAMGEMLSKYGGISDINKTGIKIMKKILDDSSNDLYNQITENSIIILNVKDDTICEIVFGNLKVKVITKVDNKKIEMYCENEKDIEEIVKIIENRYKELK